MAEPRIYQNIALPNLPTTSNQRARWGQLYGCAYSLSIATAAATHHGPLLLIAESVHNATRLELELRFFLQGSDIPVYSFPDWETLPYDTFSPHQDSISQRLLALYTLPKLKKGIMVVAAQTLMQRIVPSEYIAQHVFQLQTGATLSVESFREQVIAGGYQCVSQVMEHGEFAVRGAIIDIYPMGSQAPLRIDLFDNEIESIRSFDPSTQRSIKKMQEARLLPAREFPLTEDGIKLFRIQYRNRFTGNPQNNPVYADVSNGVAPSGCEYYLPLFFERTQTLFDYLPAGTLCLYEANCSDILENFWNETNRRYEQLRHNIERPILSPAELYLQPDELDERFNRLISVELRQLKLDTVTTGFEHNFAYSQPPALNLETRLEQPSTRLSQFVQNFRGRILFVCESAGRRELLTDLLRNLQILPRSFTNWREFLDSNESIGVTVGPLENGLLRESPGETPLAVITETQIFGARAQQRRRRKTRARDAEAIISSLTELNVNAPVVHEEHGVGRYLGLEIIKVAGVETEFLVLEYADGDKLYVPVTSLDLINRYTGASAETAPLHRLGGEQWQRIKRKAARQIRDVAAELLDLYARRAARSGFPFKFDTAEMLAFSEAFPFEETPDQQSAIDAVLEDMTAGKPMDRVVCGDVGFGKTEVAMRATFAALQNNKQVSILVPTTLLAQQHFQNFQDRFADWPFRIECLSRFNTVKEQKAILDDMKTGKVDVVIGTHKLIQKGIEFKDLGLIIVDEEHRFGVRHKEKLKALRAEVGVLTLTATPIPRTLNMSLSGLRDLSIIATPPERRNAIKTFVSQWRDELIQEACHRELMRGGQVYFVHNEVKSIEHTAEQLGKLLPEARIAVAHGQLPERTLENVMLDFYHQRFNILLCTTIIESGIDVPTANTIIINRADRFGLAQLHQLRGRVGRSHHRAYAYLFTPPAQAMTTDARKRLEAIESLEDLGAGFTLASHDLEIRGAGELLGEEQSGQIQEIGYAMYTEMLERAVNSLKRGEEPLLDVPLRSGVEIDLGVPSLLPADYIYDVDTRLVLYKRISNAETLDDLRELQVELIDRFGLLPEAAKNLFSQAELKVKLTGLGVTKIKGNLQSGSITFSEQPGISTAQLIKLIQFQPDRYQFDGKKTLSFKHECKTIDRQLDFLENLLLTRLAEQKAA